MTVLYVDVSLHDRNRRGAPLDWRAIKAATSPVMIARASYGDPAGFNPPSPFFGEMVAGAKAQDFVAVGGYHNLITGDQASINRQVDLLRGQLNRTGCNWAMCDVEPYPELIANGLWPRWNDVQQFHDRWYAVDDRVCAWYIPHWFWSAPPSTPGLGSPDVRGLRGPLVQSHYAGGDGTASQIYAAAGGDRGTGWDDRFGLRLPDIWQYTSVANVPGASGSTDVNAYRGSLSQLTALLLGEESDVAFLDDRDARAMAWRIEGLIAGRDSVAAGPTQGEAIMPNRWLKQLVGRPLDAADEGAIAAQVLAGLDPSAIADRLADALPADLAQQVVDELGARLALTPDE